MVWKAVRDLDVDRNGFLQSEELEDCFREFFPVELDGKSLAYFFRDFGCDHDKNLVNYRKMKDTVL
jgi:Ca2+-binding EF-hand superfamily protein